ncbi:hypothetical protein KVT40_003333 [Elsinoe batatas]|uniref:Uncharacterized protein n=1 Tax=Elsinoe batatas TaxID=2601811 RepID=A0A8K0LC22_9PEZI|nr:hypothetical protein KVT40_003333 [Elsinoe batatas]
MRTRQSHVRRQSVHPLPQLYSTPPERRLEHLSSVPPLKSLESLMTILPQPHVSVPDGLDRPPPQKRSLVRGELRRQKETSRRSAGARAFPSTDMTRSDLFPPIRVQHRAHPSQNLVVEHATYKFYS